jgi:hypothetical protein
MANEKNGGIQDDTIDSIRKWLTFALVSPLWKRWILSGVKLQYLF